MALTTEQTAVVARKLGIKLYQDAGGTADGDLDDLKAAITTIDGGMDATCNQVAALYTTTKLKLALLQHIQAQAPNLTNQQAGVALALWSLNEVGLL